MKKFATPLILTTALSASVAFAQQKMDTMKPMNMAPKSATETQTPHKAVGVVKKIDAKAGTLTLAHEAVSSLKWPAMTMGFVVQDKTLLDKLAVGQKVHFEFIQGANGYVVTAIK